MLEQVQVAKTWLSFHMTRWLKPEGVLLDGLVRGLGRSVFTLTECNSTTSTATGKTGREPCPSSPLCQGAYHEVHALVQQIDDVIRLAPNPFGIGDFLIRVRVFKCIPKNGPDRYRVKWRHLLATEYSLGSEQQNYLISRYHDWNHGDARQRLVDLLHQHCPTPDLPIVEVAVTSIGQLVVELMRERKLCLEADEGHDDQTPSVPG